jgi:hypothetical protein
MVEQKAHFYVFSDIHIETKPSIPFYPKALHSNVINVCCLAGDIGLPIQKSYWEFITHCSLEFDYVLLICGNHEYYYSEYYLIHKLIRDKILQYEYNNVYFLHNQSFTIPNTSIHVHGCTLWTEIPLNFHLLLSLLMTEYRLVKIDDRTLTPEDTCSFHSESIIWLKDILEKHKEDINIVLSHHSPTFKNCHYPHQKDRILNYCLSTNLETSLVPLASYWIYGHVHLNMESHMFELNGCKLISNQKGYSHCPYFDEHFYFEV